MNAPRLDPYNARTRAALILARVMREGSTLDRLLPGLSAGLRDRRERAFVQELCYGVLRWYPRLDFICDRLLSRSLKNKDQDIRSTILCGLYQLEFLRTPEHAAVSSAVETARHLHKHWAGPVINAVLRRYQRERSHLQRVLETSESANFAHPQWLISALREDWPQHWQDILHAANERPPMQLRVNLSRTSRSAYMEELARLDIIAQPSSLLPGAITLSSPVEIDALPGFNEGLVSIQDYGAQLAPGLLAPRPGDAILDACAAPGGKTAHIYETCRGVQRLTALDISAPRLELLRETRRRLDIPMEVIQGDARVPETWWDGAQYDRILLDAPCSATGVIRRHPDIKVLRRPGDIAQFVRTQEELLEAMWPLLKSGGRLVYVTCSLLARENDSRMENFREKHPDAGACLMDAGLAWGVATRYGRQTLPGHDDMDGFYYAILEKE